MKATTENSASANSTSEERRNDTVKQSADSHPEAVAPEAEGLKSGPPAKPAGDETTRGKSRPLPASLLTPPPPAPSPHLDDYQKIIGQAHLDGLHFLARDLKGKSIKMVNSTAVGGGVAEMLNRLVPLLSELDVPTHWDVITGGNDFFEVTKAFHNALHGSSYALTKSAQEIFLDYNERNRERLQFTEDIVVIHDPQPVGLIRSHDRTAANWVWRCHIDLSNPE